MKNPLMETTSCLYKNSPHILQVNRVQLPRGAEPVQVPQDVRRHPRANDQSRQETKSGADDRGRGILEERGQEVGRHRRDQEPQ